MITDRDGDKCTPKEKAQEVLMEKLAELGESEEPPFDTEDMTEREVALVGEQIVKLGGRVAKLLKQEPVF